MPVERVPAAVRRVVAAQAHGFCEYCRTPEQFAAQSFTVEHIQPHDRGGTTTLDNLAWSCFGCNSHKYTRTESVDPESGNRVALFNRRQQRWSDHLAWDKDVAHLIGKTACGRATIAALRMNRPGLVNLRRILAHAGLHPPPDIPA